MTSTIRTQRKCDHRLLSLVWTTGDIDLAVRQGVPRSTARGWLTRAPGNVVTLFEPVSRLRRMGVHSAFRNRPTFRAATQRGAR